MNDLCVCVVEIANEYGFCVFDQENEICSYFDAYDFSYRYQAYSLCFKIRENDHPFTQTSSKKSAIMFFQMSEWSSAVVANANVVLHITWLILFFKMAAFRHFRSKNIFWSGLVFFTENNYFVIYWYLLKYLVCGFDFRRKSLIALFLPQVYASPCMDR